MRRKGVEEGGRQARKAKLEAAAAALVEKQAMGLMNKAILTAAKLGIVAGAVKVSVDQVLIPVLLSFSDFNDKGNECRACGTRTRRRAAAYSRRPRSR